MRADLNGCDCSQVAEVGREGWSAGGGGGSVLETNLHGRVKACRMFTTQSSNQLCKPLPGILLDAWQVMTCSASAGEQNLHLFLLAHFYLNVVAPTQNQHTNVNNWHIFDWYIKVLLRLGYNAFRKDTLYFHSRVFFCDITNIEKLYCPHCDTSLP